MNEPTCTVEDLKKAFLEHRMNEPTFTLEDLKKAFEEGWQARDRVAGEKLDDSGRSSIQDQLRWMCRDAWDTSNAKNSL